MSAPQDRYIAWLETLSPETLAALPEHVAEDVHFRDPFNDVHGADAMARVFRHMFENVGDIRFQVRHAARDGDVCLMDWRFEGRLSGKAWAFDGASRVTFGGDGRVIEHIDYWDAAGDLYARLPLIGWLLSRLRRRLAAR